MLALLSSHLSGLSPPFCDAAGTMGTTQNTKVLTTPSLSAEDTTLTPNELIGQIIGVTSSWIDLCSPDPLIADISRQILKLEVAYAAFCGFNHLVIHGPRLHHGPFHSEGLVYYAKAIQDAFETSPYIQIHIWLGIVDNPDLEASGIGDFTRFAREEYLGTPDEQPAKIDLFGTWDAWNVIRTACKYHSRLFVGKKRSSQLHLLSFLPNLY
jgi:type II protein arginine methyltransferase